MIGDAKWIVHRLHPATYIMFVTMKDVGSFLEVA